MIETTYNPEEMADMPKFRERLKRHGFIFNNSLDVELPGFLHPASGTYIATCDGVIRQGRLGE